MSFRTTMRFTDGRLKRYYSTMAASAAEGSGGTSSEVAAFEARIIAGGDTISAGSLTIAQNILDGFATIGVDGKIIAFWPFIGDGLAASLYPLRDVFGVGPLLNNGPFVSGDYDESVGLTGDGTTKWLDTRMTAARLNNGSGTDNGGLGIWLSGISLGGNVQPMGAYNAVASRRFVLDLRSAVRNFRWGQAGNGAGDTSTAADGHYLGVRSSGANRKLYFNGSLVATNTTADDTTGSNDENLQILGALEGLGSEAPFPATVVCAYVHDGTLDATMAADLHTLINDELVTPLGR